MKLYHVRFSGIRNADFGKPIREFTVLVLAPNIYSVNEVLEMKYDYVTAICTTSMEHADLNLWELTEDTSQIDCLDTAVVV